MIIISIAVELVKFEKFHEYHLCTVQYIYIYVDLRQWDSLPTLTFVHFMRLKFYFTAITSIHQLHSYVVSKQCQNSFFLYCKRCNSFFYTYISCKRERRRHNKKAQHDDYNTRYQQQEKGILKLVGLNSLQLVLRFFGFLAILN